MKKLIFIKDVKKCFPLLQFASVPVIIVSWEMFCSISTGSPGNCANPENIIVNAEAEYECQ